MRGRTDHKVLFWNKGERYKDIDIGDEDYDDYDIHQSIHDRMGMGGYGRNDNDLNRMSINAEPSTIANGVPSEENGGNWSHSNSSSRGIASSRVGSSQETLTSTDPHGLDIPGLHTSTPPSSPRSSPGPRRPASGSGFIPAPAPSSVYSDQSEHSETHNRHNNDSHDNGNRNENGDGNGCDNNANNSNTYTSLYDYDYDDWPHDSLSDHDPSLEPAPLSLPSRNQVPARRLTASSAALSTPLQPPPRNARRNAAVIPYKMVREEWVQLNYTILVDEDADGEEENLPEFLVRRASAREQDGDGGSGDKNDDDDIDDEWVDRVEEGTGRDGDEEVHEHDALVWATWDRVSDEERLPMSEDLRKVVLEGLRWMGELTGAMF
ncbi:hypothetical protein F4777DRAFT_555330 [Nemania sp. FL0916]|nr:hypothetical protein F4777DRAFT_555330 [Nemania sp. FL0916]